MVLRVVQVAVEGLPLFSELAVKGVKLPDGVYFLGKFPFKLLLTLNKLSTLIFDGFDNFGCLCIMGVVRLPPRVSNLLSEPLVLRATALQLLLHLLKESLHLQQLILDRGLLLSVFFINDLKVLLCALLKSLGVPQRIFNSLVVLNKCLLHGSDPVKEADVLLLVVDDLALALSQVVRNRVHLVQRVVPHGIDVELPDLLLNVG